MFARCQRGEKNVQPSQNHVTVLPTKIHTISPVSDQVYTEFHSCHTFLIFRIVYNVHGLLILLRTVLKILLFLTLEEWMLGTQVVEIFT